MGLDMYVHKRTWIGVATRDTMELNGVPDTVEPRKVVYIVEDAGSWRKANAIHRWFVENVQHGNDDCGLYQASREQLQALLRSVETVLAHPELAELLLPTQEGFFFGGTDYDQYYVETLHETKRIVVAALADDDADYEYGSSW